jgi:SAM-dependent methyltransferase
VAGNDLSPVMVAEARRRLLDEDAEITEGDMRALRFETGPFDVAVNFHGSLGHLPDLQAMAQHLASMRDALRPGGLYFLGICVFDGDTTDDTLWTLYESDIRPIPSGGMAAVRYESVRRDPVAREETIVLHLLTKGVADCPPQIEERYVLRTLREMDVRALLAEVGGLDLLAVHAMTEDEHPDEGLYPNCGDVTLVLRRRGT